MDCVLSIDPGIYSIGAVVWNLEHWSNRLSLPIAGYWYEMRQQDRKNARPHQVSYEMITQMFELLAKWDMMVHLTVIEKPQTFSNRTNNSVLEMEFQRGMIYGFVDPCSHWQDVSVSEWKGQMPKDLVVQKLVAKYGLHDMDIMKKMSNPPSHDWDALGIGLYAQGFFS